MPLNADYIVDGHIHIYPHYKLNHAILQGIANLKRTLDSKVTASKIVPMWLLVERHDCHFFDEAIDSAPVDFKNSGISLATSPEKETLIVKSDGETILYIVAGKQIVTRDGLEILCLTSTFSLKDRTESASKAIHLINENGGLAVINWAPGKWFFSRGKIVKKLLNEFSPAELLIGDTSLRTTIWLLPRLMFTAIKKGFKVIAGSDPLPFVDEENQIGRYCFHVNGEFDDACPAKSLRKLLKSPNTVVHLAGKRNNPFVFLRRQFKIMTVRS